MATWAWDAEKGATRFMRSKEEAHDYRYFPEPDLVPLVFDEAWLAKLKGSLPELPEAKRLRLVESYGLPAYDAQVLTDNAALADYFEAVVKAGGSPKAASNWVMVELLAVLKAQDKGIAESPIGPAHLAGMLSMIEKQTISGKIAKTVFEEMAKGGGDPKAIVERLGLVQVSDPSAVEGFVRQAMDQNPSVVAEYRAGKEAVLGFLVGQVMKVSKGKANPALVNETLKAMLKG
jgi:aspartyl-tRNA(Asn)/glutamyl-tRNA(Gln) amidotransferase subunit B